jgi:flagellar secretion chaperone FliS
MDEARARYLRDRVLTATPAQRVVMLYDRLGLDLTMATTSDDPIVAGGHIGHASQVVAELLGSLDVTAGGPADNLAAIYGYLLRELTAIRISGARHRLPELGAIVAKLRAAWAAVAEASATPDAPRAGSALAGAWVG